MDSINCIFFRLVGRSSREHEEDLFAVARLYHRCALEGRCVVSLCAVKQHAPIRVDVECARARSTSSEGTIFWRDREYHDIGRYCTIGERAGLLFGEMALVMMIDSHLGCCSHHVRTYRWTGAARHENIVLLGDRRASQALVRLDGGTARRRGGNGGNHHRNGNGGGSLLSCSSNSNWGTSPARES